MGEAKRRGPLSRPTGELNFIAPEQTSLEFRLRMAGVRVPSNICFACNGPCEGLRKNHDVRLSSEDVQRCKDWVGRYEGQDRDEAIEMRGCCPADSSPAGPTFLSEAVERGLLKLSIPPSGHSRTGARRYEVVKSSEELEAATAGINTVFPSPEEVWRENEKQLATSVEREVGQASCASFDPSQHSVLNKPRNNPKPLSDAAPFRGDVKPRVRRRCAEDARPSSPVWLLDRRPGTVSIRSADAVRQRARDARRPPTSDRSHEAGLGGSVRHGLARNSFLAAARAARARSSV
jgi:hypothetical protein